LQKIVLLLIQIFGLFFSVYVAFKCVGHLIEFGVFERQNKLYFHGSYLGVALAYVCLGGGWNTMSALTALITNEKK